VDTAEVTASDQPDPDSTPDNNLDTEDDQDAASLSPAPRIDLALTQVADKETVNVGDTVTITLTLTNQGPSAATGVAVTDTLPAGLVADSYTPSQGTCVANVCALGTVANNGTVTITIVAHATTAGALENLAEVTSAIETDVDSQPAEDALTVPNQDDETALSLTGIQIDLSLTMTVSKSAVAVGDSVVWNLTLHNAGPSTATGVKVTDVLPSGLSLLDATATNGAYDAATDTWSIATLNPDGTATLTITTRVDQAGANLNTAQVKAANEPDVDSTPNNNLATEDDQDAATVTGTLGNVAGTLWIDTNGNGIVDPSEPTLSGVTVKLIDGAGNVVGTAVTDAGGNYSFPGVAPGTYELVVDPATLPLTVGGLTYDADAILNGRHTIVVTGDGAASTNFGYAPAVAQAQIPRTGATAQLPLVAGLLAVVLVTRARRRITG
ncbi:MAG: SdrD B-like domain-containing protein, partial [Acidimicrobiales bacterium]|nr:SdrD B-like domain-containing protein [Acidimicrobiales bacterium]